MPELPEVETVKRSLQPVLEGETITGVEVYYPGIIKKPGISEFRQLSAGKKIQKVERRGKYLLFQLSHGYTLVIHLRMTGQLILASKGEPYTQHTHVVFCLTNNKQLRFVDIRKFGLIFLIPSGNWQEAGGLSELGPEPLAEEFTLDLFRTLLQRKRGILKAFLLDQKNIAGIGNIYADEVLFFAGLHPQRSVETLTEAEIETLYAAIRAKLAEGVEYRGTSVRNYVDGQGEKGGFQERLQVYDHAGLPCPRCGATLIKTSVAGRGTVYCPRCQGIL